VESITFFQNFDSLCYKTFANKFSRVEIIKSILTRRFQKQCNCLRISVMIRASFAPRTRKKKIPFTVHNC